MGSNAFLVSLLCAMVLIGAATVLCGWIESRFTLLARWANRTGRSIDFPAEAHRKSFQWSLRSTLLVMFYAAITLGATLHDAVSREMTVMVGLLVGATIGAFDYAGRLRIGPLGSKPLAGAIGGLLGAVVTLTMPLAWNALVATFLGAYYLDEIALSRQIFWWMALAAVIGSSVGFVAESLRYRRGRLGEKASAVEVMPRVASGGRAVLRRFASTVMLAVVASLLIHAAVHASFLSVGHGEWYGIASDAEGPITLEVGVNESEIICHDIYCPMYPDDDWPDWEVVMPPFFSSFLDMFPENDPAAGLSLHAAPWENDLSLRRIGNTTETSNATSFVDECMRREVLPQTLTEEEVRQLLKHATTFSTGDGATTVDVGNDRLIMVGAAFIDGEVTELPGFEGPQDFSVTTTNVGFSRFSGPGFFYERRGDLLYLVRVVSLTLQELSVLEAALEYFGGNDRWNGESVDLGIENREFKYRPTKAFLQRIDHLAGEFGAFQIESYNTTNVIVIVAVEGPEQDGEFVVSIVERSRQLPRQGHWVRRDETSTFAWSNGRWQPKQGTSTR